MAKSVSVKLNLRGINAVMTSRAVSAVVARKAKQMQEIAGPDFEANIVPHRYTARAYIRAANYEGAKRQASEKVLERALGAA